jgi:hypothetical protein
VIAIFEEQSRDLAKAYNAIHSALQKAKLLKAKPDTNFPSKALQDFVFGRTYEFAQQMKLENVHDVYQASGPNVLVFAKLILSIYRRARDLYMFEAEGRIQRATSGS